jgi:hypothetical protein
VNTIALQEYWCIAPLDCEICGTPFESRYRRQLALGASPTAVAAGPKPMHISASGGDKTASDKDGTQGSFADSM